MATNAPSQFDPTKKPAPTEFSRRLMRERQRMQFSRREVGDHCGVSQSVVERWERGESIPSVQQFKRLVGMKGMRRVAKSPPEWGWAGGPVVDGSGAWDEHKQKHIELVRELDQQDPVPRPPPQSFGEGLRRIREENGVTQETIGELLGVTSNAVGFWERDEACPVRDNLDKLVQILPELEAAIAVGAVKLPESRDISKPIGPLGMKFPRATTVDTMLEMAFEQSDKEAATPRAPRPRWSKDDVPDEIDRLADEIGDPTMPQNTERTSTADVEAAAAQLVEAAAQLARSHSAELAEAYARARVQTIKARRAVTTAMEALTNAQTHFRDCEATEKEALELLDLAIMEEANG